jgi:sugar-specific transcriptional regulator TrmB
LGIAFVGKLGLSALGFGSSGALMNTIVKQCINTWLYINVVHYCTLLMHKGLTNKEMPKNTTNIPASNISQQQLSSNGTAVLVGLGLSARQAWVYLALLRVGDTVARPVASLAGVPRQEVYGLLSELQQMGLVRQNLTTPTTYTATPFIEAAKILFENRANELTMISQKAKQITEKYIQTPTALSMLEPPLPCFGTVREGERGKKYSTSIQGAQGCVELVSSWGRFRQLCFYFEADWKAALKRGVKIRAVAEKLPKHYFPKWVITQNYPNFELKTTPNPPIIAVFDGVKVAVAFDAATCLMKGPDLWSEHAGLVAACRGYFDRLWAALE